MTTTVLNAEAWVSVVFHGYTRSVYPLTTCCRETSSGSPLEGNAMCRGCLQGVEPLFADRWLADGSAMHRSRPTKGWGAYRELLVSAGASPTQADRCVAHARERIAVLTAAPEQ